MQLEQIERAALVGNLVKVKCNTQEGNGQVEVLCIRFYKGGQKFLRPVARLYKDQFEALEEVIPPEAHRVHGLH